MTKNSHFNPCFWTALWNDAYLDAVLSGNTADRPPRDQHVTYYNRQSGKILEGKVSAVHKHKGLGFAEFTHQSAIRYSESLRESGYIPPRVRRWKSTNPVFLDAEALFCGLEAMPTYKAALDVVRNNHIQNPAEKMNLAAFLVMHNERLAATWAAQPDRASKQKSHNLEHIALFKHRLSNPHYLFEKVLPIAIGAWYLHKFEHSTLFLGDMGFPTIGDTMMAAISPRHLIAIDTTRRFHAHLIPEFETGDIAVSEQYNKAVMESSKHEVIGTKNALLNHLK